MPDLLEMFATDQTSLYEATIKKGLDKRILVINQEINDSVIEDFAMNIIWWNEEDKDLPVEKRNPIKIIINSPGGDAILAFGLIDVIKLSKTPVIAVGIGCVASAAYYVMIGCHERIATPNTVLLQHDGYIQVSNSTRKGKDTMEFFEIMEEKTKKYVLDNTKMDEEFYDAHYDQEFYMYASTAKELGCIDKILGEDVDLDYIL